MPSDSVHSTPPSPIRLESTANPGGRSVGAQRRHIGALLGLSSLVGLALFALFWEPDESLLPLRQTTVSSTMSESNNDSAEVITPSAAEQEALRQQAQTLLAALLPVLKELDQRHAAQWSSESYADISANTKQADLEYAQRRYQPAIQGYQKALEAAQALLHSIPNEIEAKLTTASAWLESGSAEAAKSLFDTVLLMEPNQPQAMRGLERVMVNAEVMALWSQSTLAIGKADLESALMALTQAHQIDPEHQSVYKELTQLQEQQRQQLYQSSMSLAYRALHEGRYAEAIKGFQRALELQPNDAAALTGLSQATTSQTLSTIDHAFVQAQQFEANEQWTQAVESYRRLFTEDGTRMDARLGLLRSEARLSLENQLQAILEDPLKLQSDSEWEKAKQLLQEAQAIARSEKTSNQQLGMQIAALERYIINARIPITVTIQSDGLTAVEILRVGKLGTLSEHTLELIPGRYVALGKRSGFRDVRQEFEVLPQAQPIVIQVQTQQKVSL